MMKFRNLIFVLLGVFLLSGCGTTYTGQREKTLKVGVYATADSIDVGRIDLAHKFIGEVKRITPEPDKKDRLEIKPSVVTKRKYFITGTRTNTVMVQITNSVTRYTYQPVVSTNEVTVTNSLSDSEAIPYIVVPEHLKNMDVLVVDSQEYNSLLDQNKALKKQVDQEKRQFEKYTKDVAKTLELKGQEIERAMREAQRAKGKWGFWKGISIMGYLFPIGLIALVVMCVLNPAIIPIVVGIFGKIIEIAGRLGKAAIEFVNWIIKAITEWRIK